MQNIFDLFFSDSQELAIQLIKSQNIDVADFATFCCSKVVDICDMDIVNSHSETIEYISVDYINFALIKLNNRTDFKKGIFKITENSSKIIIGADAINGDWIEYNLTIEFGDFLQIPFGREINIRGGVKSLIDGFDSFMRNFKNNLFNKILQTINN